MDILTNRKSRRVITCICIITIAFILVSIFIVNKTNTLEVDAQQTETQNSTNNSSTIRGTNISSTNVTLPLTPTEIFSKVQDSVVQVTTTNTDIAGPLNSGLGSGFVYDNDGHIITNYHVVALASLSGESSNNISSSNNNTDIIVTFNDGSVYNARVVGSDRFSDIAVLRVENISESKLVPLTFGNSSQAKIGEQVVAIGNPFGLSGTLTVGVVSGLGRTIPSLGDDQQNKNNHSYPKPLLMIYSQIFPVCHFNSRL